MARVVAIFDDLLLGSNAQGWLAAGGHEVTLASAPPSEPHDADVLVVDLNGGFDGLAVIDGAGAAKLLGVYSHVDVETRDRALQAGFDQVVPRSRFAREGAALVDRLLS